MKIAMCLPIHGGGKPAFIQSFGRMMDWTYRSNLQGADGQPVRVAIETLVYSSSSVAYSRCKIAAAALEWGADWLLWLDADQTFPPATLVRLLGRQKAVVGANYRRREPERVSSTAFRDRDGKLEPAFPQGDGIEPVAHLGLGICLTHADVFRRIERPFFFMDSRADGT
ncbi:MAG: hypothetical protein JWP15_2630, partial [Alphaproteobacteria bacterium]|nr:hypothetical protein [Alphaproteobacteria bacterium]